MPKLLKDGQKRKITVTVSVDPDKWEQLDERCKEMQDYLRSKGAEPKDVATFTRSALVRECVNLACRPEYVAFLKLAVASSMGVDDSQMELFGA